MSNLRKRYAKQQAIARRKRIIIVACVSAAVLVLTLSLVIWGGNKGGSTAVNNSPITSSGVRGGTNITVQAGKEVVWTINAGNSLGCYDGFRANSSLGIPQTELTAGASTTVRFTPKKTGSYTLRCLSMGMPYNKITVK
jgi:plastocyanin domain-containing protein